MTIQYRIYNSTNKTIVVQDKQNLLYIQQEKKCPFQKIVDPNKRNFLPEILDKNISSLHKENQFLHLASLMNYNTPLEQIPEFIYSKQSTNIWQQLHEIGIASLAGPNRHEITHILLYYSQITKRAFFDISELRKKIKETLVSVELPDGKMLIVSNILLTALVHTHALIFIAQKDTLSSDELLLIQAIYLQLYPLHINKQLFDYVEHPRICRYIYTQTTHSPSTSWQDNMSSIIYF
ncbi:hypothetical protein KKG22_03790 [Patescibacteria group bacterium]|nr:hypothetical protein [Patescibacteria group bacterium]MBU1721269.1 hypothetical protein [Patescibacteria group bacterium]MBU1901023.1 hypothetical protein [Patescibacteria group bacterium]